MHGIRGYPALTISPGRPRIGNHRGGMGKHRAERAVPDDLPQLKIVHSASPAVRLPVTITSTSPPHPPTCRRSALTLLEMLVVMGMIVLLASMLLPSLSAAREQAKSVVCRSNLNQLIVANGYYAEDNDGVYCPGAESMHKNLHRWHGQRDNPAEAFDSTRGPLVPYLGAEGRIRQCPTFPAEEIAAESGGFERGNGGYGYNNAFIGVQLKEYPSGEYEVINDRAGALVGWVVRPAETIMFAETAFAGTQLIEYSFVEPRYHPSYPDYRADPSIHFRHNGLAGVGWCDGHVDAQRRTLTFSSGIYMADPDRLNIGWFGQTDDNSLFDLK